MARAATSPRLQLARGALLSLVALTFGMLLDLVLVSGITQRAAQEWMFAELRGQLARGTAPIGPVDSGGHALRPGTPVAYLEIPSIGVKEVVVEGTTAGNLFTAPGHRRDTPLPGQSGVSVVFGRRASFGGPFSHLSKLKKGATIRVTTGQGKFTYTVRGLRHEGDPVPPAPAASSGRLLLVTAAGHAFVPAGVLRVDADLEGRAAVTTQPVFSTSTLPATEQIMATEPTMLWALALWLQFLLALVLGGAWAWRRWGPSRAWPVLTAPLLLVALSAAGEAARLLPNLL